MTIYSADAYKSFDAYLAAANAELKTSLPLPITCYHKLYKEGQIISVRVGQSYSGIMLTVQFAIGVKTFVLDIALSSGLFDISETIKNSLLAQEQDFKSSLKIFQAQSAQVKEQTNTPATETTSPESVGSLEALAPEDTAKAFDSLAIFYENLGWLAKHVEEITAVISKSAESWFVTHFGAAAEYQTMTDDKKFSKPQIKFKASFDSELPAAVTEVIGIASKKSITSVPFIWDLIKNYGFQFGKDQDVDRIFATVPSLYETDFSQGYDPSEDSEDGIFGELIALDPDQTDFIDTLGSETALEPEEEEFDLSEGGDSDADAI